MMKLEPMTDYILGRPILSTRNPVSAGWPIPQGYMGNRFIIDQLVDGEPVATAYRTLTDIDVEFNILVVASENWIEEK